MASDLRIVFIGTPDFAVASLRILVENGINIVGVLTAPDKPAGRGNKLRPSAVKEYASSVGLPILQPTNLKDPGFLDELRGLKADLQIVVAFRMLPEAVWNMPPMGTFNLHGSLLPQYRGAAPINRAIMNGETETGVTTFLLKHEIDTGSIIHRQPIPIGPDETAGELHDKMMHVGAELVLKTVHDLAAGTAEMHPQSAFVSDDEPLKTAPKIHKNTCQIDWSCTAQEVFNHIRGLSPYPAAWTKFVDARGTEYNFKVFRAAIESGTSEAVAGTPSSDGSSFIEVSCSEGAIRLLELQLAGKKRMRVDELLRGFDATVLLAPASMPQSD